MSEPVVACYCATFLKPEMLHIYRQITGLRKWRPVVFCQKREEAARYPFPDVCVVARGKGRWLRRLWQKQILGQPVTLSRGETRRLETAISASGADVLHVYFGHIAVQLLPLLRRSSFPTVVSFHGADVLVDVHRRLATEVFHRAARVTARSESLLHALRELGCPPEKLRLHRTGIPLREFKYVARTPPADGAWRLFQACRLIEKKGLAVSLRAFRDFAAAWPNARLTIAGEGPLEHSLRALAAESGLAARVDFTGFLSQEALRAKLCESHLFLHPSELGADGNQEGVPNSLLEAMATGLPVFATRHGGIPEAIEHGVSGWLGGEGDSAALAGALIAAAADPARLSAWGQAGAAAVAEKFEQTAQVAGLEAIYREAAALS